MIKVIPFLCLFLAAATSGEKSVVTRKKSVAEGDNLLVVCAGNGTTENTFWQKNDTDTTFRQNGTLLTFVKINRTSAGVYCGYRYDVQRTTIIVDKVFVDVQYPAEITNFTVTPTTITENETFTITCSMIGNPSPSYMIPYYWNQTWHRTTNTSVTVSRTVHAQCKDMGEWGCYARNKLNSKPYGSIGVNVTVFCSPRPQLWHSNLSYHVESRLGQSVKFQMFNEGYPPSNYTWSHKGVTLPSSQQEDFNTSVTTGMTILNISSVSIEDFGNYTLTMMNSVGTYTAVYRLLPTGPPYPPTNLTYYNVTKEGATISWISGFDMWQHQTFVIFRYLNEIPLASIDIVNDTSNNHGLNEHYTYVVTGFHPRTNYTLVVASVSTGYTSFTNVISFKTKESSLPQINAGLATMRFPVSVLVAISALLSCIYSIFVDKKP